MPEAPVAALDGMPLIEARSLTMRFGGIIAVDELAFAVHPGELVGLIGPNGSGKTTTINMLTGHLAPAHGEIMVRGARAHGQAASRFATMGVGRTFLWVTASGADTSRPSTSGISRSAKVALSDSFDTPDQVALMVPSASPTLPSSPCRRSSAYRLEFSTALAHTNSCL